MKAKRRFLLRRQRIPPAARGFQQRIGTDNIGLNERRRAINGTIDMAFRREVHHRIGLMLAEDAIQLGSVTDIHLFKGKTRILRHRRQRHQIAGVGQLIHNNDAIGGVLDDFTHYRGANKARAAGDQNRSHRHTPLVSMM